ncbi:MAG: hypothetical protein DRP09_21360 [Candidatus Thorarchaeota archaeon]|nr:MAG: hypothetical protein DRP09_21360 [Candidatus Thorarchaeota archaeon]
MSYLSDGAMDKLYALCPKTLKNLDEDAASLADEIISKYNKEEVKSAERLIFHAITTVSKYLLTERAEDNELDALLIYFENLFIDTGENPIEALIGVFTYYLLSKPHFDSYRHLISSYVFDEIDLGEAA